VQAGKVSAKAKVDDLDAGDLLLLVEHYKNVFWLEVAVYDLEGMQVPQAYYQLLCDLGCIVLLQESLLANEIEEATVIHSRCRASSRR
jgi:hypothetical protein